MSAWSLFRLAAPRRALWFAPGTARARARRWLSPMHHVRRVSSLARSIYTGYRLARDPAGELRYQAFRAARHAVRHALGK
jgi:hypothetical protein